MSPMRFRGSRFIEKRKPWQRLALSLAPGVQHLGPFQHRSPQLQMAAKKSFPGRAEDCIVDKLAGNRTVRPCCMEGSENGCQRMLDKQGSPLLPTRRALLAAVAASCFAPQLLLPGGSRNPPPAFASIVPPPGWSPLVKVDIGRSAFDAVEAEFSPEFSALLARFLANNEPITRRWWVQKQREAAALAGADTAFANWLPYFSVISRPRPATVLQEKYLVESFSSLIASVDLGLEQFESSSKVAKLASSFEKRYKTPAQKRQLAQLFSLVAHPNIQPYGKIATLLGDADNARVDSISLIRNGSKRVQGQEQGYLLQTADPQVIISSPPATGGRVAKAKPVLRATGRWRAAQLLDGGLGYADGEQPEVTIMQRSVVPSSLRRSVVIRATTRNGLVDALVLDDAGSGYLDANGSVLSVELLIAPPANRSSRARAARATLLPEYELKGLNVTDGGSGYNTDEPPTVMVRERFEAKSPGGPTESTYVVATTAVMKATNARAGSDALQAPNALRALEKELLSAGRENGLPLPLQTRLGSSKESEFMPILPTLPMALLPKRDKSTGTYRLPISIPTGAFGKRADAPVESQPPIGLSDVLRIFLSGAVCSGTAHTLLVPLDVVKTTLQQNPQRYAGPVDCAKDLIANDGPSALTKGAGSTLAGYLFAGGLSFGLVEVFGRALRSAAGPGIALLFGPPLLIGASAGATAICATALCPFEAVRVKSVESGKTGRQALQEILAKDGIGGLFRGFVPILAKEIPFVVTKFVVFNALSERLLTLVENAGVTSSPLLGTELTVLAGVIAGIAATVTSQPADVVFTLANKGLGISSAITKLQERPALVATGFWPRLLFCVLLVTLQFFLYGLLREALGVSKNDLTLVWDALAELRN